MKRKPAVSYPDRDDLPAPPPAERLTKPQVFAVDRAIRRTLHRLPGLTVADLGPHVRSYAPLWRLVLEAMTTNGVVLRVPSVENGRVYVRLFLNPYNVTAPAMLRGEFVQNDQFNALANRTHTWPLIWNALDALGPEPNETQLGELAAMARLP